MRDEEIVRSASCTCGAIRFEVRGAVVGINYCHCSKCRKETGTAGSTFIPVRAAQLRWLAGEGTVTAYGRCPVCGSLAPHHNPRRALYNVPAGLLEDDTGVGVAHHIFVDSKAGWDIIGGDAPQYLEDEGPMLIRDGPGA
jgi:hypothetical protein